MPSGRWSDYYLAAGDEFSRFWRAHFEDKERRLLFYCGLGFDPRMCDCIAEILSCTEGDVGVCALVHFNEGPDSPSREHLDAVSENERRLRTLCDGRLEMQEETIDIWNAEGRPVASIQANELIPENPGAFSEFTDVIVDPSALPRSVYLTLIAKLLHLYDLGLANGEAMPNLHVVLSDSPLLDSRIVEVEPDDSVSFLHGFSGGINRSATADQPRVWFPILGEKRDVHLRRIHDSIGPSEVCLVLPSPSQNPRRGDDLLREHRLTLFDTIAIEPANIIYASDSNPFDVYRQLRDAVIHYNTALKRLGGAKFVVSTLSSKLVSVGALLAGYELRGESIQVGFAHVETHGYDAASLQHSAAESTMYSVWIAGEAYV